MLLAWLIRQPGRWQVRKVSTFLVLLIICQGLSVAQQEKTTCLYEVEYENNNFLELGALTVCYLKGQVTNEKSAPIPQSCLGV
jgi:hypothetical protein